jgi:hypothetical protein
MFGVTSDSPLNTYSAGKHLGVHARVGQGECLDYIFFVTPLPHGSQLLHFFGQRFILGSRVSMQLS